MPVRVVKVVLRLLWLGFFKFSLMNQMPAVQNIVLSLPGKLSWVKTETNAILRLNIKLPCTWFADWKYSNTVLVCQWENKIGCKENGNVRLNKLLGKSLGQWSCLVGIKHGHVLLSDRDPLQEHVVRRFLLCTDFAVYLHKQTWMG